MNKSSSVEDKVEEMVSIVDKLGSLLRGILCSKGEEVPSGATEIKEAIADVQAEAESVESKRKDRPSKSDLVREFFKKHGTEVSNKDVVAAIKKESGVELTDSLVSSLKKKASEKSAKASKKEGSGVRTSRVASGSALIREYLEEKGLESSNDEVVKHLKKQGVSVRPTLVSSVRAILKKKGVKTVRIKRKTREGRGPTMPSAVIEALKKAGKEGMELSEVAQKVVKSGYVYKGSKGIHGVTQNVFQALHSLSKKIAHPGFKGTTPVVIHEKNPGQRFGRYRLNPKAMENKVA